MKKGLWKKAACLVAVALMVFAMTACGGESEKIYAGYYSAAIPEGFTVNEYESEFVRQNAEVEAYEDKISVDILTGTSEDNIQSSIEYWGGRHQRLEDVTYGDRTWKVETFTWNGDTPSCMFYTDIEDNKHVLVTCYMLAVDSEEVKALMESFKIQEGAYEKNQEFLSNM